MIPSIVSMRQRSALLAILAVVIATACGSGSSDGTVDPGTNTETVFLSPIGPTLSVVAGGRDSILFLVSRQNYTGPVTLALVNPPAGITATFNPAPVPANGGQAYVRVSVAASVAAGTYPLTVGGTYNTKSTSGTVQVVVTPGTQAGNVSLDLAGCLSLYQVLWVAGQDGAGAWTRLTGANQLYRFNVTSGKGGVAWVLTAANAPQTHVMYGTQAELTAGTITPCQPVQSKILNATITGLTAGQFVSVSTGNGIGALTNITPSGIVVGAKEGAHDLIAYKYDTQVGALERAIIRRDQTFANSATIPAFDFSAAATEPFATSPATLTVTGTVATETHYLATAYLTGPGCDVSPLRIWGIPAAAGSIISTGYGIPDARQRATDFHELYVTTTQDNPFTTMLGTPLSGFTTGSEGRTTRMFFHTHANRTIALGAQLAAPAVTSLTGAPYKRLQAVVTVPTDYTIATLDYGISPGGGAQVAVSASVGWLGTSTAVALVMPDLSAVAGWSNSWPPSTTTQTQWSVTTSGTNLTTTQCVEGGYMRSARRGGSIN